MPFAPRTLTVTSARRAAVRASRGRRLAGIVASLALLATATLLPHPASALQVLAGPPGQPADAPPPAPGRRTGPGLAGVHPSPPAPPPSLHELLSPTPQQAALLRNAQAASREAHATALESQARLVREDSEDSGLRKRAQLEDQAQDARIRAHRAARDSWIALDESLDAAQRQRLRAAPEAVRWLGWPTGLGDERPEPGCGPGPRRPHR